MAKGNRFGTFGGVFTPSILTILGVIMYMRLPWIVGHGGLFAAIGIILVAHVISITTGLSVSSIATNKTVEAGGPYYIVSRSLGLAIGGTLGLALFIGLAFSISLYVIGFSESFLRFWELDDSLQSIQLCGTITLIVITAISLISTALAIKTQYLILGAIVVSLVAIFGGDPSSVAPAAEVDTGRLEGGASLALLFGIFFPAVTGFTAGVNMSGDLEDPRKALPRGTMAAIVTGLVVYLVLAAFLALKVDRAQLIENEQILLDIALWGPAVVAGVWGATISSALGSILGAPRILQALSLDRVTPRFFGRGYGKTNEPRTALILVFLIAEAGILIGELNVIAAIVSMFFIMTYGFLNLVCALESWASPDFRPEFRIPALLPIVGAVTCVLVMVQLDLPSMLGASAIFVVLFLYLKRRELSLEAGDTWDGVWGAVVRAGLQRLSKSKGHPRNWTPNVLLFRPAPERRDAAPKAAGLLALGESLVEHRGVLTAFELGPRGAGHAAVATNGSTPRGVFHRRVTTDDSVATMASVCRYHGISGLMPNTVMVDWQGVGANTDALGQVVDAVEELDCNVLVLAEDPDRGFGSRARVDVWWSAEGSNVPLSITLGKFLGSSDDWRRAELRVLIHGDQDGRADAVYATTRRLLTDHRVEAVVKMVGGGARAQPWRDCLRQYSADADLTVLGLPARDAPGWTNLPEVLDDLGSVLFVKGSTTFERLGTGRVAAVTQALLAREEVAPEAPDGELRIPEPVAIATECARFADAHDALGERFVRDCLVPANARLVGSVEGVRAAVDAAFTGLDPAARPARQRNQVARARRDYLRSARRLMAELQDGELLAQQSLLERGIERLHADVRALRASAPTTLVVQRDAAAFEHDDADPASMRRWKARRRFVAWVRRQPIRYRLRLGRLYAWYLDHRIPGLKHRALRAFGTHGYRTTLDLGEALLAVRGSLARLARTVEDGGLQPDGVAAERAACKERLDDLVARVEGRVREHAEALRHASRRITQELADDLDRLDFDENVRRERRIPVEARRVAAELEDVPTVYLRNQALLARRVDLALRVAGWQHDLAEVVDRTRRAVDGRVRRGVVTPYAGLVDGVRHLRDRLVDGSAELSADLSGVRFDDRRLLDDLAAALHEVTADLPETVAIPGDEAMARLQEVPFEEAEPMEIALRGLADFLVEADLIGPVANDLEDIAPRVQRAVGVAQDVVRLISFDLHDLESAGVEDQAVREHVGGVIDEGVERLDAQLANLEVVADQTGSGLERHLDTVLERTTLLAITASADALHRYVKSGPSRARAPWLGRTWRRLRARVRRRLVRRLYHRRSAAPSARRADLVSPVDAVLGLVEAHTPPPDVLDELPFYYRQLFLGKSTINRAFWVGRAAELEEARRALDRHRRGFGGALLVTGERHSGKTALCQTIATELFDHEQIHHVFPPPGGSIDPAALDAALARELQIPRHGADIFQALPDGSVLVFHDLELWWERSEHGSRLLERLLAAVDQHGSRCFFVFNLSVHALRFIDRFVPLSGTALSVIGCGPMSAQELETVVTLRHDSTGLRFELEERGIEGLNDWGRARFFTGFYDYAGGSIGTMLQAWIAALRGVDGKAVCFGRAPTRQLAALAAVEMDQIALLLQLVLHKHLTLERLARVTGLGEASLNREVATLQRMGLVERQPSGVLEINRFVHHLLLEHLQERGLVL